MRVNQGQEFVIGGYTPGPWNLDALIFGTTKATSSFTLVVPEMGSRRQFANSCSSAFARSTLANVPLRIFLKVEAADGKLD